MSATATAKKPTHIDAFGTLCAFLKKKPEAAVIVSNHIAAKHKIHTLVAFHHSDAVTDDEKLKTYVELAVALSKGDHSKLLGQVAAGQAETPPAPEPPTRTTVIEKAPPGGFTPEDQVHDPLEEKKRKAHTLLKTTLRGFLGGPQLKTILELMKGEEREFFYDKLAEIAEVVEKMPKTYEDKDTPEDEKIVHLHYFVNSCDWFILEKDKGSPDDGPEDAQTQAFGYANLGDPSNAELGYISLPEITAAGAELDLHWEPKTLGQCKAPHTLVDDTKEQPAATPAPAAPAPTKRLQDYAEKHQSLILTLNRSGIGANINEKLGAQFEHISKSIADLHSRACRQAVYNAVHNVPLGIMLPEDADADAAMRSAIAGYVAARVNHDTSGVFKICADIMEDANLHEEAALLRSMAGE